MKAKLRGEKVRYFKHTMLSEAVTGFLSNKLGNYLLDKVFFEPFRLVFLDVFFMCVRYKTQNVK